MIFPWQKQLWQQLGGQAFPHAFLIHGPKGIGKLHFAKVLAQALLCETSRPGLDPCESCLSCHWYRQESHPDFKLLQPEAFETVEEPGTDTGSGRTKQGGSQIAVGQIRALAGFLDLSAHRQGKKVVLVHPADELNVNAANALLKTLEEPPRDTVLLLVAHRIHRILPTVRSRCRALPMRIPIPEESTAWMLEEGIEHPAQALADAGFAPLQALDNTRGDYPERRKSFLEHLAARAFDPVGFAATHEGRELPQVLGWLQKWTYDLVSMRLTGHIRYNPDFKQTLQELAKHADAVQLERFYRALVLGESRVRHPLNPRLVLEHLFLSYQRCMQGAHR